MATEPNLEEAIETLQQLGLKEYEARCFVGLARLSSGTAKTLSEITDVPRTRVYDAIRVLETKGLVEIHHSSPQEFRAVSVPEAIETLREQYETRLERVKRTLEEIEPIEQGDDSPVQEIWSMGRSEAIENRAEKIVANAEWEIVLVVGHESVLSEDLCEALNDATAETQVFIGAGTDALEKAIRERVPGATTFTSGLEWLRAGEESRAMIGRLMLVDRSTILVSSLLEETGEEKAIYGEGFGNGFVVLARRLMAHGLVDNRDPQRQ